MTKNTLRALRLWLYGVAVAFVPAAVYFGWIEPEATPIVIPLLIAIFNISPKEGRETGRHAEIEEDDSNV